VSAPVPSSLLTRHSIELSARHPEAVAILRDFFEPGTEVFITYLPDQAIEESIRMAASLAAARFVPVPHVAARALTSREELRRFLETAAGEAGVDRILAVAGDRDRAQGPLTSALDVIESGLLEAAGISGVGLAGHPEGHPAVASEALDRALLDKLAAAARRGLRPRVVTQFCFEVAPILAYLDRLKRNGVAAPVRIGIAGPAELATLTRFAARCGIGNSIRALVRRPSLAGRLALYGGPEPLLDALALELSTRTGGPRVEGLHVFPFGGARRAAEWSRAVRLRHAAPAR
jgi:methylenetetrahydrofolate reductase (NADPH)